MNASMDPCVDFYEYAAIGREHIHFRLMRIPGKCEPPPMKRTNEKSRVSFSLGELPFPK